MYDFQYNYVRDGYCEKAKLLVKETDSSELRYAWLQWVSREFKVLRWDKKKNLIDKMKDET